MQPLFKREKDLLSLLNSKDGLDKIKEFAQITSKIEQNCNTAAKDLIDWQSKACALLPDNYKANKEFLTDLSNLVAKYEITSTEHGDDSEDVR